MEFNDKRIDIITNKMGLSLEIAQWSIRLHKKYALWAANQIKENPNLYPKKTGDFETIIDWKKEHPNVNLNELKFATALRKARKFFKEKNEVFRTTSKSLKNKNVVLDLGDYKWVELLTQQDCKEEGDAMGHCIGGYKPSPTHKLFSLRDKFNVPHVSISLLNDNIGQYKGEKNSEPKEKYLEAFLKLIANHKIDRITDNTFWNSLKKKPEYVDLLDKTHAHLITFAERVSRGLGISNKFIYSETICQTVDISANQTFSLPEDFKIFGDFKVIVSNPHAYIHIGDGATFAGDLDITAYNITFGQNIKIGGNLTIQGGINNLPKNIRVCGDVKIILYKEKHVQKDLYNFLEGLYSGGYLDIDLK